MSKTKQVIKGCPDCGKTPHKKDCIFANPTKEIKDWDSDEFVELYGYLDKYVKGIVHRLGIFIDRQINLAEKRGQVNEAIAQQKDRETTHKTQNGYCCACEYDLAVFEGKIKEAEKRARKATIQECIEALPKEKKEYEIIDNMRSYQDYQAMGFNSALQEIKDKLTKLWGFKNERSN